MTDPLDPNGVRILLVYGAKLRISRDGRQGIRVSAGYHDGSVMLEAVGFNTGGQATAAICEAAQACLDAGLGVSFAPHRMSNFPARIIRRKAPPQ